MDKVIEVKKLSKTFRVKLKEKGIKGSIKSIFKPKYKVVKAVNNVSFNVEKGEIIAFIGPNGAGKSTTIKMLTGILYPDSGNVSVLGIDPKKDRKKLRLCNPILLAANELLHLSVQTFS